MKKHIFLGLTLFITLLLPLAAFGQEARNLKDFRSPTGIAIDQNGAVYASEWGADRITRLQGNKRQTVLNGISAPAGLAFDKAGKLYIASYGDGNIYVWDGTGKPVVFASGFSAPTGLFMERDGALLVANRNAGEIIRISADGAKKTISRGHRLPVGIARTADGDLFASCYGGSIDLIQPDGSFSPVPANLVQPGVGIVPGAADSVFVVDYGGGRVAEVNANGLKRVIAESLPSPVALASSPDGSLLVGTWGDGALRKFRGDGK